MTDWAEIDADAEWGRRIAWDLYGEPDTPLPPAPEHCPRHGEFTPFTQLQGDCPRCLDDDRIARQDAEWDWRIRQHLDRY